MDEKEKKYYKNAHKETVGEDEIYTEEEAKKILNMLKKKRPKIK